MDSPQCDTSGSQIRKLLLVCVISCLFVLHIIGPDSVYGQNTTIIFHEDFESGPGTWSADNGLWEIGIATAGPDSAYSDQNLAGTVLAGNYSDGMSTRLISPAIALPGLASGEKLLLKFWYWLRVRDDHGFLQVSADGGAWETISQALIAGTSPVWVQYVADLSEYVNSTVQIGFLFSSDASGADNGWYIDDVAVESGPAGFKSPESFEGGVGNWSADSGLWQIGVPSVGPPSAHTGTNLAGTVLNDTYTDGMNTRLISPEVTLTPKQSETPMLCFFSWFRNRDDGGFVQISVRGGDFVTIAGRSFTGTSTTWTQTCEDLSAYADSTVRIAFLFTSDASGVDEGWYIDDVRIEGIVTSIAEIETAIPLQFVLHQNYPNPFNPETTISYQLPKSAHIVLTIYNLLGQEITKLVDDIQTVGVHTAQWDGRDSQGNPVSSGVYLYRIKIGSFVQTRKMLLLE